MNQFTLNGMRVIREVVRWRSFSVAADRLGYTQPAVSRQVAAMERAAGRPLFEREPRGVRPTEAGRALARRADVILSELRAAHQDVQDVAPHTPTRIRLGAFSTALAALVPRAIANFLDGRPGTQILLREGLSPALLRSVARGHIDLAVTTPQEIPAGVEVRHLMDDPLYVATEQAHSFAGQASVDPGLLQGQAWISGRTEPDSPLLGAWASPGIQPEVAFVVRDWVAKLGLAAAGLGITVVPGLVVPALPRNLSVSRIDHPDATRPTAVAFRSKDAHKGVDPLLEALRDAAAELTVETRERLS